VEMLGAQDLSKDRSLMMIMIHPHVVYGIEVCVNTCKAYSDKLHKLNNRILRILLNKKFRTPTAELYKDINMLPLPLLHEFQVLIFVHRCLYLTKLVPIIYHNYFIVNSYVHKHDTRRKTDLHLSAVNLNFGQRSMVFRGSNLWNNLPNHLKLVSSASVFKKNLKIYLLNRNFSF